jgi:hypothetical protein
MSTVVQYERKFGEIDDLLLRLKGLVLVRGLLAERGADESALRKHSDEIRRLREQLAELVKGRAA